jgi:hypothetical protein
MISGQPFVLTPLQYIFILDTEGNNYICFSIFVPMNINDSRGNLFWILGNYFLSRYYSVFDIVNNRTGFARSISYDWTQSVPPSLFQSNGSTLPTTNTTLEMRNTTVATTNITLELGNATLPITNTTLEMRNSTVAATNTTLEMRNTTVATRNTTMSTEMANSFASEAVFMCKNRVLFSVMALIGLLVAV